METLLEPEFVTYTNLPVGSTATELGPDPATIGPKDVKTPVVVLMLYIDTLFPQEFAAYANFPDGAMAMESVPQIASTVPKDVRAPVVALMAYMEMVPGPQPANPKVSFAT